MKDERMVKTSARKDRETSDAAREEKDGTALSMEQRKLALRNEMNADILPNPNTPPDPNWHYCWLSSTNQSDPIYKRLQLGYELVKASDLPKFALRNTVTSGEFEGCIAINEMILSRIPMELYQEIMKINHHERPMSEEEYLKANAAPDQKDSSDTPLGIVEGFESLGKRVRAPTFT